MYAAKNPVTMFTKIFAVSSAFIFPLIFILLCQQFATNLPFALIFALSCLIGLTCSFILLFKFDLPQIAFPGIAIYLLALNLIACC